MSDYVPAVGDVVEFEWCRRQCSGVTYMDSDGIRIAVGKSSDKSLVGLVPEPKDCSEITRIGKIADISTDTGQSEAIDIAKAYFSPEKRGFKVGDKVRYKGNGGYYTSCIAGEVVTVRKVRKDEVSVTRENGDYQDLHFKDLASASYTPDADKSYAENQGLAVKFYGWVKGSKVRVVRSWKPKESGFELTANRGNHIGEIMTISNIAKDWIDVDRLGFPYFALEPA